jgi:hypothetical protein
METDIHRTSRKKKNWMGNDKKGNLRFMKINNWTKHIRD